MEVTPGHFPKDDLVQPFQIENNTARGRLVRLGPVAQTVIGGHDYPEPVASLLSEMLALTALVAGIFKFEGVFSLQAKGDGPVGLLVADMTSDGGLRGFAQYKEEALVALGDTWRGNPVPYLLGGGYLAFTVDQGSEADRYQGIVDLTGATLADCAHNYFRQSDQFDGAVKLTAGQDADGNWRSGGLLVQKMPPEGMVLQSGDIADEEFEDAWRRAVILMGSSKDEELLGLDLHPHELLFRLFNEDGVRVFHAQPLEMRCRCSEERVQTMLKSFPREEIEDLKVDDNVVVTCEFCGRDYAFTDAQIDGIYNG
ncbi:MAG: Hsp33 family molecular chaperone HslO [Pseudomonadota bacterium]|nr:Hsp33 family molecular chaperone HslO [Pseudomonadota bacterium]